MKKLRGINLAIVILAGILTIVVGATVLQMNSDKIVKNTFIKDVNVGGLTKEEAKAKIKSDLQVGTITFVYQEDSWTVEPNEIDTNYNINQTVDNAFNSNRNKGVFKNIFSTIKSYVGDKNEINVVVNCDEKKVREKLEKISEDINVEMENATLNVYNGKVVVGKEKAGLELDIDTSLSHLKKSLQRGIFEESLTVAKVEPEVKSEDLESVDTLLGSFSTRLSDISPGRVENIKIATERTSGVLLMPGEEFSYNKYTGMRTIKNGYKNATVIVSGEAVQGVGGGVCQVSTTLYDAVLYAGLDIVKVTNHSIPSSYVGKGKDATVSDNGLDFIFKNNYDVPVYIKNYYSNGIVTCQIYGNSKNKQRIEIVTSIDKVGSLSTKKEKDPSLKEGTEKVIERGRQSYTVSTYRVYYDNNGNEIRREKVATSYYPSKQQVIAIGTKKEDKKEEDKKPVEEDDKDDNNNSNNDSNNSNSNNSNSNNDSNNNSNNEEKPKPDDGSNIAIEE